MHGHGLVRHDGFAGRPGPEVGVSEGDGFVAVGVAQGESVVVSRGLGEVE